jgi:hypothetical protein
MSAGRQRVKVTETKRLIQASLLAGLKVRGVEYDADGKVRVLVGEAEGEPTREGATPNDWRNVVKNAQD